MNYLTPNEPNLPHQALLGGEALCPAVIAKLIDCQDVPTCDLPEPWARIAHNLEACPKSRDQRAEAFTLALASLNGQGKEIRAAVFAVDPLDPLPSGDMITPLERAKKALNEQESGDGDLMAELCKGEIVFDHAANAWHIWGGHYWKRDQAGAVFGMVSNRLAPQYLRAAADAQAGDNQEQAKELIKRAAALRNRKRADNALHYVARHPSIALTGNEWDQKPQLLAVNNGVVDLETGEFRGGRPDDYLIAHTPTDWEGLNAPASTWEKCVQEILNGDRELYEFMQRALGYGIGGEKTEHVMLILLGEDGRNGKSTLLETLANVLGSDLTTSTQADAIMDIQKSGDGPRPFVYSLRGKRIVWASESNEGRRINGGLVKQLTGGDRLSVRTLHSKPVEFKPTHLLLLITNHKPHMSADDQAIWDRVLLVPFMTRFVDNPQAKNELQRDKNLQAKLMHEAPGILAWLVKGYLQWQKSGLMIPQSVRAATDNYRDSENTLIQFMADCCISKPEAQTQASALYKAYDTWCKDNNIPAMTGTAFGDRMGRSFERKRTQTGKFYIGIGLLSNE